MQSKKPNLIKVAILAAGGREEAAKAVGAHPITLSRWVSSKKMPLDKINLLCRAGGIVSGQQILDFIEASRSEGGAV